MTEQTNEQQVIDGSELQHRYYHQMLNMAEDDLDPYQYRLLGHYLRWVGHGGKKKESLRQTADGCKMSSNKTRDARQELADLGYVRLKHPTKAEQHRGQPVVVTVVDRWIENILRYAPEGVSDLIHQTLAGGVSDLTGGVSDLMTPLKQKEEKPENDKKIPALRLDKWYPVVERVVHLDVFHTRKAAKEAGFRAPEKGQTIVDGWDDTWSVLEVAPDQQTGNANPKPKPPDLVLEAVIREVNGSPDPSKVEAVGRWCKVAKMFRAEFAAVFGDNKPEDKIANSIKAFMDNDYPTRKYVPGGAEKLAGKYNAFLQTAHKQAATKPAPDEFKYKDGNRPSITRKDLPNG